MNDKQLAAEQLIIAKRTRNRVLPALVLHMATLPSGDARRLKAAWKLLSGTRNTEFWYSVRDVEPVEVLMRIYTAMKLCTSEE